MSDRGGLLARLGVRHPVLQAPMAGCSTPALAVAVAGAGGLGSLACAMLTVDAIAEQVATVRKAGDRPINLNFFCHRRAEPDPGRDRGWAERLSAYYSELGLDPGQDIAGAARTPFGEAACKVVEELRPRVVSFHFGLPAPDLLRRVKATGAAVLSSATTVAEALWLEAHGVDAVIAQGVEAGGHRGMFLSDDVAGQPGLFTLVPQVVDAVRIPVVAAGGIADARGVAAAFALGAAAIQVGTAYLFCPECGTSGPHRAALGNARDDGTALTNVFTGRPARGIVNRAMRELGPISAAAPAFPEAAARLQPLRQAAEAAGSGEFSPLWAGQAAALGREIGAAELTRLLADAVPGR